MKNKFVNNLIPLLAVLFIASCANDDTLPVDFEDLEVSGGAFAQIVTATGSTDVNKLDPASSSFSREYQIVSPAGGTDVTSLDVYVSLNGGTESLLTSIPGANFVTGGTYPQATVNFDGSSILSALGISAAALEGGDTFDYRLELTNADGTFSDVSANFDNQSADHTFSSTIICVLAEVPAGDWTVQMADSYGDGWQTTASGGGAGITVTLNDGTILEVGLCSPYGSAAGTFLGSAGCTPNDGSAGTGTITIPPGTTSAEWFFPGDFWGEISFTILSPAGNVVAEYGAASAAGPIALNLCNE